MSRKTSGPSESEPQPDSASRRDLLKRVLVVLGAGVLIQPNGGVVAFASEPDGKPKKDRKNKKCEGDPSPCPSEPPGKPKPAKKYPKPSKFNKEPKKVLEPN